MDFPSDLDEPGPSSGIKRKRCTSKGISEGNSSEPDEGEVELYNKYFVCERRKTKKPKISIQLKPVDKHPKKRKYTFNRVDVPPRKSRNFYFIRNNMTKPRKLKTSKSNNAVSVEKDSTDIAPSRKMHFAQVTKDGSLCLKDRRYLKHDLFFNDEKRASYETVKKQDLNFNIVDEIALEGLDGITLETFWKRMYTIFPNHFSKKMEERLWRIICNNKRINFYILNEPRQKFILFDRSKYMDLDTGVFMEPLIEVTDVYPHCSVPGEDVRGSCSTYKTRKENNGVRKFSMDKAVRLYDQRLIFVADQTLRNKTLISEEADANIDLVDIEYCMLERIGRSREQGEVTQGKHSLQVMRIDNKNSHHHRKVLQENHLIVNQFFYVKSLTSQQIISGGLIHLSRFYAKRKSKQMVIMEQLASVLREKPNYQMTFIEFRSIFGIHRSLKKLLKTSEFRRFFKTFCLPYTTVYPLAPKHEWLSHSTLREKQVRIMKLIDPSANVAALLPAKDEKESAIEPITSGGPGHKFINCEYLRDIFLYILSKGLEGVTLQEVHEYFKMDYYSVRMALRKMLLRNIIDSRKIDLGRQQSHKFYAKCLKFPDLDIKTEPKIYELMEETKVRVLESYSKISDPSSINNYCNGEAPETVPTQNSYDLDFEPFPCSVFLTETVDSISEEQTIFDIVLKGRDRLLLAQSNLFAHYINEWDDFIMKRESFSRTTQFFQLGFGKIVYDYLSELKLIALVHADNKIIFNVEQLVLGAKIVTSVMEKRTVQLEMDFSCTFVENFKIDAISKTYLFEALMNLNHSPNNISKKLKTIFERSMVAEGKTKRKSNYSENNGPRLQLEIADNVVMESFMGNKPVLEYCTVSDDGIKTEVYTSTRPLKVMAPSAFYQSKEVEHTQRFIDRANLILKIVYAEKIVKDVLRLFKDIRRKEAEEGYRRAVCKKSIYTILNKLVKDGFIQVIKVIMSGKDTTRTITFVSLPYIDVDHGLIKASIEQLKLKFYIGTVQSQKTIKIKKSSQSPFSMVDVKQSICELKRLTKHKIEVKYKFNKNIGKVYGYCPKYARMRVLHEFLFYVIKELGDKPSLETNVVAELFKRHKVQLPPEEMSELPAAYCKEISWKTFIPPLPNFNNWPKGWVLACDMILRMPLSVFVKLCNISFEIPELLDYLNNPVKRHYLLRNLPQDVTNALLHRRKYFVQIYETFSNMCHVGLTQFGPRNFKEKDQVFVYLNMKASLYDTTTTKPGYHLIENKNYKKIYFNFKTSSDVGVYWSELWRICMNTQLGKRKHLEGQYVTIEDSSAKPSMLETLNAKSFDKGLEDDDGHIPGDHKGAAGLDSSLWAFVKRNWFWNQNASNSNTENNQSSGLQVEKYDSSLPQPVQLELLNNKAESSDKKVYLKSANEKQKVKTVKKTIVKKSKKRKKVVRKIRCSYRKRIREYYDTIDKVIMKQNNQLKVEWDDDEDQLLRFSRAATAFLTPVAKKQFIPYTVIRDVMHKLHPKSKNKTARAIQRRMYFLLLNDEIIRIMETNVENFLNSDTVSKYFAQIRNQYRNNKINDPHMYVAFVYLMGYIYQHKKEVELLLLGYIATVDFFSDPYLTFFEMVLQKVEEDNKPSTYMDPKVVHDIRKNTIKSIVHSSMACKTSPGWVIQLFHIYKKYPDELIRLAFNELKKTQFLVINKETEDKAQKDWHIPLKFSQFYYSMKNSTYAPQSFSNAYKRFLGIISDNVTDKTEGDFIAYNELNSFWPRNTCIFDIPEMGIILNPVIEDHSEVIEELAKRFRHYLFKIQECVEENDKSEEEIVPQIKNENKAERSVEDVKTDVMRLVFRVPYLFEGDLELHFKKMLDSATVLEINHYIFLMIVDLKQYTLDSLKEESQLCKDLKEFLQKILTAETTNTKLLLKNMSKVVFAIQTIQLPNIGVDSEFSLENRFKFWELELLDEENRSKDDEKRGRKSTLFSRHCNSSMEKCIKNAQNGDILTLDAIKEGMMSDDDSETRNVPHITDLIMLLTEGRFPELDTSNDTIEKMKEHFVLQYPSLQEFIVEESEELQSTDVVKQLIQKSCVTEIKQKCASFNIITEPDHQKIDDFLQHINADDSDVAFIKNMVTFINGKKQFGASAKELKEKFSNGKINLAHLLEFLCDTRVLLRTGMTSFRYVYFECQADWLVETFSFTTEENSILVSNVKHEMKKIKLLVEERLKNTPPAKVQLKPWSKLDGTLNADIFVEWLCLVLSYCLDFPNCSFSTLCEHFCYVKPVDIYYLLEVLEQLSCLYICLYDNPECGILSARCIIEDDRATCLDDFDKMYIRTTNIAGLSLGSFLDQDDLIIF